MQEIVPLIMSGGDPASVETLPNWDRVPWLEEHRAYILDLDKRPSPRMFSTHFHYNMMPPAFFEAKPKVNLSYTHVLVLTDIAVADYTTCQSKTRSVFMAVTLSSQSMPTTGETDKINNDLVLMNN